METSIMGYTGIKGFFGYWSIMGYIGIKGLYRDTGKQRGN